VNTEIKNSKNIIQSIRAPFLILTPACVFLGLSIAIANQVDIDMGILGLALLGGLLAHTSVNALNEYFDFKSGLDLFTRKTPFSGGSGALPATPGMLNAVLLVGITSLVATLMIGVFFIWQYGAGIAPPGLTGMVLIIFYTGWINKFPYLCLVAPGIGFGVLMVVGTQYVLTGHYLPLSWMVAVIPFLLVNNLLLLNQYPDIEADSQVGRNHFPIAYGIGRSNLVYGLSVIATVVAIITYILLGYLPMLSLIALFPLPLALYSLSGAIKYGANIGSYPQYLALNVVVAVLTPLLLGVSLIYG
jgi:1,4-dihydroxy-2-naphthoate octaprenyltransferase